MVQSEQKIGFSKETFTHRMEGKLTTNYETIKELGSGSYGKVFRVKNKTTGEFRACKQLSKAKISNLEKFNMEIDIMTKADHPNIIKLYEIYEDSRYIYLIMEECKGGELFDRIIEKINAKHMFSEKQAAAIFKELMSSICYCHSQKICHRDLKPENILFLTQDDKSPIKVIDFGLSKMYSNSSEVKPMQMKTKVGTAYYVSPEVLKGNYDEKCDVWSAGVILYILLSGEPPFNGANDNEIYRSIEKKKFSFPDKEWKTISAEAKDIIKHMLCEPNERYTAEQVLQHVWIANCAPNAAVNLDNLNLESLKTYKNANRLKKAVLTFIASRLNDTEVKNLKAIFETLDKNKDGTLTFEEMKEGIEKLNKDKTDVNVEELFKSIDTNNSGVVNYTEFIAASMDQKLYMKEERLFEAFKMFDKDGSGKISIAEFKNALKIETLEIDDLDAIVKKYDVNGDGEIDYNEFLSMINSTSSMSV